MLMPMMSLIMSVYIYISKTDSADSQSKGDDGSEEWNLHYTE
jgi:hypothetical protein